MIINNVMLHGDIDDTVLISVSHRVYLNPIGASHYNVFILKRHVKSDAIAVCLQYLNLYIVSKKKHGRVLTPKIPLSSPLSSTALNMETFQALKSDK